MGLFGNRILRLLENLEGETEMDVVINADADATSLAGDTLEITSGASADGLIGNVGVLVAYVYAGAGVAYPDGNTDWSWAAGYELDVTGADIIFHTDSSRQLARFLGEPNYNGGLYAGTAIGLDFEWMDRGDDPIDIYVPGYTDGFRQVFRDFRAELLDLDLTG